MALHRRRAYGVVREGIRVEVHVEHRPEGVLDRQAERLTPRDRGQVDTGGGFVPGGRAEQGKRLASAAAANAQPAMSLGKRFARETSTRS